MDSKPPTAKKRRDSSKDGSSHSSKSRATSNDANSNRMKHFCILFILNSHKAAYFKIIGCKYHPDDNENVKMYSFLQAMVEATNSTDANRGAVHYEPQYTICWSRQM